MKKLVTTPLTGTIYWATVDDKKGIITGERKDVTDNAVSCVLDHFMSKKDYRENGFSGYTYGTKVGGETTLCAVNSDTHVILTKRLYEELKEYRAMYDALCK